MELWTAFFLGPRPELSRLVKRTRSHLYLRPGMSIVIVSYLIFGVLKFNSRSLANLCK